MLASSSPSLVLFCPKIPRQDQAKESPAGSWSNLPPLKTTATKETTQQRPPQLLGPPTPPVVTTFEEEEEETSCRTNFKGIYPACHTSSSSMSNVRVCPYPQQGISSCTVNNSSLSSPSSSSSSSSSLADLSSSNIPSDTVNHLSKSGLENMDNPSRDLERIKNTLNKLETSGWYYGQLSWQQATNKLKSTPVGTFLIRDSSDPMHLFSLSVQTERGPTSIRIHYSDGEFKLDAEDLLAAKMPSFPCVVALVDHYVNLSKTHKAKAHVWLDLTGRRDRHIQLSRPLYHQVPQLQHLCRLVINGQVPIERINQLPKSLQSFIKDFPYKRRGAKLEDILKKSIELVGSVAPSNGNKLNYSREPLRKRIN